MEAEIPVDVGRKEKSSAGLAEELLALGFPRDILTALEPAIAATRLVRYAPGDIIYHQGTEVDILFVIRSGRIKLLNYLENGRSRIVRLHNRGSVIGLNGLLGEPHTHTAVATAEVVVYQVPMHLIKVITDEDPDTYSRLLEIWHEYLNMADTWITDFSTGAIRGRVARLLLFLVETDIDSGPSEVALLTVEEMAEILGVTPESVSRIMADMKRKKILQAIEGESAERYLCNIKSLLRTSKQ